MIKIVSTAFTLKKLFAFFLWCLIQNDMVLLQPPADHFVGQLFVRLDKRACGTNIVCSLR